MSVNRLILLALLAASLIACNKSQPAGVPETSSTPTPTAVPAATPPPAAPAASETVAVQEAPPPLDAPIPAYEKTGFPDCDDYIETYRQCLNTRLGSDERKPKAGELQASVRSILGNIARGVDATRVANHCKRARSLASKKLTALGCTL